MRAAPSGWVPTSPTVTANRQIIMNDKIAIPLNGAPGVVLLDNGERTTRKNALKAGYRIADAASLARADSEHSGITPLSAWRSQVTSLPEAQGRPSAAAQLIEAQPLMSLERVRSFLRGLPIEQTETTEETMKTDDDPYAARRAQISGSAQAFNRSRGYAQPHSAAPKPVPAVSGVEPEKLKRFAEIRFSALQMNGHGHTQEAKKLKCALDAHATTGAPLSRLLAQLGVDTAKLNLINI